MNIDELIAKVRKAPRLNSTVCLSIEERDRLCDELTRCREALRDIGELCLDARAMRVARAALKGGE